MTASEKLQTLDTLTLTKLDGGWAALLDATDRRSVVDLPQTIEHPSLGTITVPVRFFARKAELVATIKALREELAA